MVARERGRGIGKKIDSRSFTTIARAATDLVVLNGCRVTGGGCSTVQACDTPRPIYVIS